MQPRKGNIYDRFYLYVYGCSECIRQHDDSCCCCHGRTRQYQKYSNQEAHPVEEENKIKSSGYKDAYKNASGAVYNPYKRQVVVTSAESGKDTSVADWCSQNMDLLIKISSSHADIFLIPNDKLDGIDIYSLSKNCLNR